VRVLLTPASAARTRILVDDAWFGPAAAVVPTVTALASVVPDDGADAAAASAASDQPARSSSRAARVQGATRRPPASTGARVVINEVMYDPADDGADADGEWVELYNASEITVSLDGWTIADGRSADVLPTISIEPGGFAIVAPTGAFAALHPAVKVPVAALGSPIGNGLGNDGDVLVLVDPAGVFVDAVSWGNVAAALSPPVDDVPEGHSIERRAPGSDSDTAADWVDNDRPTPGEAYHSRPVVPDAASGQVAVIAGGRGRDFDWVPWAMASVSLAALAGTAGWRLVERLRTRAS
jgi:hypothetical protein